MTCTHLRQLFELCDENKLRFSSSDLVHIVCKQCEREEVCPSVLLDQYETQQREPSSKENDKQQDAEQPAE
jgi:hypothetical protein